MIDKVKTKYYKEVRKKLETKLNGGNIIVGINTYEIFIHKFSLIRTYSQMYSTDYN